MKTSLAIVVSAIVSFSIQARADDAAILIQASAAIELYDKYCSPEKPVNKLAIQYLVAADELSGVTAAQIKAAEVDFMDTILRKGQAVFCIDAQMTWVTPFEEAVRRGIGN